MPDFDPRTGLEVMNKYGCTYLIPKYGHVDAWVHWEASFLTKKFMQEPDGYQFRFPHRSEYLLTGMLKSDLEIIRDKVLERQTPQYVIGEVCRAIKELARLEEEARTRAQEETYLKQHRDDELGGLKEYVSTAYGAPEQYRPLGAGFSQDNPPWLNKAVQRQVEHALPFRLCRVRGCEACPSRHVRTEGSGERSRHGSSQHANTHIHHATDRERHPPKHSSANVKNQGRYIWVKDKKTGDVHLAKRVPLYR